MSGRRIAISLALSALVSTTVLAHSPSLLPNAFDSSDRDHESHTYALTLDIGE